MPWNLCSTIQILNWQGVGQIIHVKIYEFLPV